MLEMIKKIADQRFIIGGQSFPNGSSYPVIRQKSGGPRWRRDDEQAKGIIEDTAFIAYLWNDEGRIEVGDETYRITAEEKNVNDLGVFFYSSTPTGKLIIEKIA
jgi:hypothetical protein